jgi:hypothetical protein
MSEVARYAMSHYGSVVQEGDDHFTDCQYEMEACSWGEFVRLEDYDALTAKCAELEKDAARYRKVRDHGVYANPGDLADWLHEESLDAFADSLSGADEEKQT